MEKKIKSKIKETGIGDSIVREINQIHNSKYHNELRNELLGKGKKRKKIFLSIFIKAKKLSSR